MVAETAELVVSELVTNAVVHAATPVDVEAIVRRHGVRVEVADGSPHPPVPRAYEGLAGTGRGLRLLEELADEWGVQPHPRGKTVWFELRTGPASDPALGGSPAPARGAGGQRSAEGDDTVPPSDVVEVVLLRVPVLLHAAWQIHAESLQREYLLTRLDEDNVVAELEQHAAVNDAMSLLREHIPEPDVGVDAEAVMAAATEPLVTADRIVLPVPAASVAHFRLLDDMMEAVAVLADAGAFLTAPVQPELKMLRRWLCRQVADQAKGAEPAAWFPEQQLPPPHGAAPWDSRELVEITRAPQALIAADDTNRIVAVSGATLTMLGYPTAEALVGHRLVTIIPDRYRQAHLAGFTLHLAAGRGPLLGRPVNVPVLRPDGTEITVELNVNSRHHSGRSLFIAELRTAD